MRSLSTKPAFQSAYDSLVGIFADTSRKVRFVEFTLGKMRFLGGGLQVDKLEEDEKRTRRRKEAEAVRKLKRAEQRQRRKLSRKQQQQQQHRQEAEKCRDGAKGTLVQEFESGKREIWIMPGADKREKLESHDTSHDAETKSGADTSHDASHDTSSLEAPIHVSSERQVVSYCLGLLRSYFQCSSLAGAENDFSLCSNSWQAVHQDGVRVSDVVPQASPCSVQQWMYSLTSMLNRGWLARLGVCSLGLI